jgi:DNA polymerase
MFGVPVEKNGVNGRLRQKGKVAELALGYGGGVGALKAMGALEMGVPENELLPLVEAWRDASPNIVRLWWNVDAAVKTAIRGRRTVRLGPLLSGPCHPESGEAASSRGLTLDFIYRSGMLFIRLPSGRCLSYVRPRLGRNHFGGESVEYVGIGPTKKWERIESYGPKFVENIVQGISRDLLAEAMLRLTKHSARKELAEAEGGRGALPRAVREPVQRPRCVCDSLRKAPWEIVAHVHDELIIETDPEDSVQEVCDKIAVVPSWATGLLLRADGFECSHYQK